MNRIASANAHKFTYAYLGRVSKTVYGGRTV